ncbi:kazrin-like isoform X2 [Dendronephthya gigantea]|uniref:kazrin-like isoform X2 n=1 Tax=Dendronephthya gigantea TaxID=151771 RepID=UPI0010690773|nr:kazrin-like isoform X2 [Dendronephthya gigantea]
MAQPSDGNSSQITESACPKLNAAISEFEKLTEKHRLFTSSNSYSTDDTKSKIAFREYGDELISCLSVMRRLMEEAESENRQLKQEKFLISTKIGSALGAVNREVEQLRVELQKQDRRLIELNSQGNMKDISADFAEELRQTKAEKAEIQAKYEALNSTYQELTEKSKNCDRLGEQVRSYKDDITRANETINVINIERRRLKSEKQKLLGQLREAYCIIDDKEGELRDFIKNYEERMRESEQQVESIANEKQKWMEEKRLMTSTTPTQFTQLKRQLDDKDRQLNELHTELAGVKDQLAKLQQTLSYPVPKSDQQQVKRLPVPSIRIHDSGLQSASEGLTTEDSLATSIVSGPETPTSDFVLSNSEVYTNHATEADDLTYYKKRRRYGRLGLVRVFSRGKKKSVDLRGRRPLSSLSSDGDNDVSDLAQIWQSHKTIPISQWKSPAVIAFLHVHLQMPMYTDRCMENVKSGKILADMSDTELSKSLGIISYIHRRKIRLAIEDFRHPASVKYPKMGDVDHHYVAHDWLTHIGLSQYAFTFETQMVDGRLLSTMTRKDIEKYLNITSKPHQDSILFGVELLKHLGFDREVLAKRKEKCDEYDHDPIVWSNERVIRWCESINLKEYSNNLRSSGVFGGLLVLNHSFGPEELALCLNIPAEKTAVRKHLIGELSSLMINARAGMGVKFRGSTRRSLRGRSKSFHRHSRRTGEYDVSNDDEVNRTDVQFEDSSVYL